MIEVPDAIPPLVVSRSVSEADVEDGCPAEEEVPRGRVVGAAVAERELAELRAEVTRTRILVCLLRQVVGARYDRKHTLSRDDRDLFARLGDLVDDYDAVVPVALQASSVSPSRTEGRSTGLPTAEEYESAISDLRVAQRQLAPDGLPCALCADSGHQAFDCRHNLLVVARAASSVRARLQALHETLHLVGDVLGPV